MSKTTLFNKSERTFQTAEGDLLPHGQLEVSEKLSERLLKLYPDELTLAAAAKAAGLTEKAAVEEETEDDGEGDGTDETVVELKTLTKAQLAEYLTEHGIAFETDANKTRLLELATAHQDAAKAAGL